MNIKVFHPFPWIRWSFAVLFLTLPAISFASTYTLYIKSGTWTVNGSGGATLRVWGFTDSPSAGPMLPGPQLEAQEGDTVSVTVYNQHTLPHNFVVRGITMDETSIPAGGSKTYVFQTPKAGVYLFSDTLNSNVDREMGLYGALVVRAAGGVNKAWTGGPTYNFERLWVLSDVDKPRWNDIAGVGGNVNTSVYRPNYFMINGMGGFDAMRDPNTVLQGPVGQVGMVRIVNAGQFDQSLHFHANHFYIIDQDGQRLSNPEAGDTINVKAGTTAMLLYTMYRPGDFPMHVHTAQMETANGVYLNGAATLIIGQ